MSAEAYIPLTHQEVPGLRLESLHHGLLCLHGLLLDPEYGGICNDCQARITSRILALHMCSHTVFLSTYNFIAPVPVTVHDVCRVRLLYFQHAKQDLGLVEGREKEREGEIVLCSFVSHV
jgi:hypothetical protein